MALLPFYIHGDKLFLFIHIYIVSYLRRGDYHLIIFDYLNDDIKYQEYVDSLSNKNWIVFCEKRFKYKDYKDNGKIKFMTLDVIEFIKRFLLHILPERFKKIRYYGLMSSRNRKTKLLLCKRLTSTNNLLYLEIYSFQ